MISLIMFISLSSVITSILVITSVNPVHAVFFLILSFVLMCGNLFILELDFLPLIFIVVYVGAISILFLFVVMMLDIKFILKQQQNKSFFSIGAFCCFLFFCSVYINFKEAIFTSCFSADNNFNWNAQIDKIINLNSLGQYIYSDFIVHFLVIGLILLVAIIGAVVLTVQLNGLNKVKKQHVFKQVSKTNSETYYVIK
jgi:NADH-quinone oxidoreductase subunit J